MDCVTVTPIVLVFMAFVLGLLLGMALNAYARDLTDCACDSCRAHRLGIDDASTEQ